MALNMITLNAFVFNFQTFTLMGVSEREIGGGYDFMSDWFSFLCKTIRFLPDHYSPMDEMPVKSCTPYIHWFQYYFFRNTTEQYLALLSLYIK